MVYRKRFSDKCYEQNQRIRLNTLKARRLLRLDRPMRTIGVRKNLVNEDKILVANGINQWFNSPYRH